MATKAKTQETRTVADVEREIQVLKEQRQQWEAERVYLVEKLEDNLEGNGAKTITRQRAELADLLEASANKLARLEAERVECLKRDFEAEFLAAVAVSQEADQAALDAQAAVEEAHTAYWRAHEDAQEAEAAAQSARSRAGQIAVKAMRAGADFVAGDQPSHAARHSIADTRVYGQYQSAARSARQEQS